jgi:hypothetical protein
VRRKKNFSIFTERDFGFVLVRTSYPQETEAKRKKEAEGGNPATVERFIASFLCLKICAALGFNCVSHCVLVFPFSFKRIVQHPVLHFTCIDTARQVVHSFKTLLNSRLFKMSVSLHTSKKTLHFTITNISCLNK